MRDNGEVMTESEDDSDGMPELVDASDDDEVVYPVTGESLVARRALNTHIKVDDAEQQRENIFHTRCHVNNKEYEDVFPNDVPSGLPPIRGIEHQIDFVPGATIPNRPAYRSNPEETKELQRQVEDLMSKGGKGLAVDEEKVKAIKEWPTPKSITEGDWVWVHMRKERFPAHRKTKLHPRGDGPFQILEKINDNAHKVDLPGEYKVSTTFTVSDLSPFDVGEDSRSNPFEERGNDGNQSGPSLKDPLQVPDGPITRSRAKKIKEAMQGLVQSTWDEASKSPTIKGFHSAGSYQYEDVFPMETPHGLPPIRGIEHQIDFVPGATIPNRPAYRSNPEETKELQRILSDPLQLGPRAKTLRQEVHFSYHTQLSDRQELLRSSRNLSQKMTPWHKEHSNGLCSQDHILRTQARLCARPVPLKNRVFLTRNKLICKPGHVGKKTHSCTTWNSRIAKILPGLAGILIGKLSLKRTKNTPVASVRGTISHEVQARIPANPEPCKSRQRKLSDGTKNVKIRHRELESFPTRNKLIREPGCVGKIMTPATTWNSRFADSIPRLTGIFAGKVHKNSSDTPTSGSHNSPRPNSDSCKLYTVGKRTSRAFRRYAA
uniref:Tf2-1-like SH3-like domain-containing protein n=1 Tax=Fagus sylvatica TaxID=28930 RepID=A0A2N9EWL6_FAGSY